MDRQDYRAAFDAIPFDERFQEKTISALRQQAGQTSERKYKNMNDTIFDYEQEGKELPSKEEILQNEDEMIAGLLEAAAFKSDDSLQKKIEIKRNGKLLFSFFVRPLTEEEIQGCRRKATKRRPDPRGRQFGMIELETDYFKLRSYKIIAATVDKGQGILWKNKKLKDSLNVIDDVDVVETVLMAGEKDRISNIIDEISGYGADDFTLEDTAKN